MPRTFYRPWHPATALRPNRLEFGVGYARTTVGRKHAGLSWIKRAICAIDRLPFGIVNEVDSNALDMKIVDAVALHDQACSGDNEDVIDPERVLPCCEDQSRRPDGDASHPHRPKTIVRRSTGATGEDDRYAESR